MGLQTSKFSQRYNSLRLEREKMGELIFRLIVIVWLCTFPSEVRGVWGTLKQKMVVLRPTVSPQRIFKLKQETPSGIRTRAVNETTNMQSSTLPISHGHSPIEWKDFCYI